MTVAATSVGVLVTLVNTPLSVQMMPSHHPHMFGSYTLYHLYASKLHLSTSVCL